jgi:putative flippase GtrA
MRFSRFASVGALCALLSNILVIALGHYGCGYVAASLLAFGPVLLVGYVLHTTLTFKTRASYHSFFKYALAMALNFPLWIAGLFVFCDILKVPVAIAAPTTTGFIFLFNYLSARWALVLPVRPSFRASE